MEGARLLEDKLLLCTGFVFRCQRWRVQDGLLMRENGRRQLCGVGAQGRGDVMCAVQFLFRRLCGMARDSRVEGMGCRHGGWVGLGCCGACWAWFGVFMRRSQGEERLDKRDQPWRKPEANVEFDSSDSTIENWKPHVNEFLTLLTLDTLRTYC